jgi:hypothetical protein
VPVLGTVQAVPGALDVLAAALWLVLAGAYLAQGPRIILADLRDLFCRHSFRLPPSPRCSWSPRWPKTPPGSWAFTFAYAAAAADALVWLAIIKPPGAAGYAIAVITLLTSFVSWIAFRTVVLAVRAARCRTSSPWPTSHPPQPGRRQ